MESGSIIVPPGMISGLTGPRHANVLKEALRSSDKMSWRYHMPDVVLKLKPVVIDGVKCWQLCEDTRLADPPDEAMSYL